MISASLPSEALAQLGPLGQLSHLYPPVPSAGGMTPEFLAPPPRPYARYGPRRPRDAMPAPPPPSTPGFPPVPGAYVPYLPHPSHAAHPASYAPYLYRARAPQPPASYPVRPRPTSGFVPPAPQPHSPPVSAPAPAPPPREVGIFLIINVLTGDDRHLFRRYYKSINRCSYAYLYNYTYIHDEKTAIKK